MRIPPLTYTVVSAIITGLVLGTLIALASKSWLDWWLWGWSWEYAVIG